MKISKATHYATTDQGKIIPVRVDIRLSRGRCVVEDIYGERYLTGLANLQPIPARNKGNNLDIIA